MKDTSTWDQCLV